MADGEWCIQMSFMANTLARNPIRNLSVRCREIGGITLAGGRPPYDVFPLRKVCTSGPGIEIPEKILDDDALNYGPVCSSGLIALRSWGKEFVKKHHRPSSKHDTLVTSGSTDLLWKLVCLTSEAGEAVMAEEFTYPGIFTASHPFNRPVVGVEMDSDGMIPESLDAACIARPPESRARVLYLVPIGHNPTGITMSLERRKALYAVARKHNLLIIEDDPYCFLTLGDPDTDSAPERMPGCHVPVPSFLSIDEDGRVARLDSFSKLISPSFRLGFITAHSAIIDKLSILSEVTTWSLSGVGQVVVHGLLAQWGEDGFDSHIRLLQKRYTKLRNNAISALNKHVGDLVRFEVPKSGMFIWIEIPGVEDTTDLVEHLLQEKVMVVPGSAFSPSNAPCRYVRISFTQCEPDLAEEASKRFARALRAHTTQQPSTTPKATKIPKDAKSGANTAPGKASPIMAPAITASKRDPTSPSPTSHLPSFVWGVAGVGVGVLIGVAISRR